MEMEQVSGSVWRCPICLRQREVTRHFLCADEIRDISPTEAEESGFCGAGKLFGALAVGVAVVAGIAILSSSSENQGEEGEEE
jgi:hypothetical protein